MAHDAPTNHPSISSLDTDLLVDIASYLEARDILSLGETCSHFGWGSRGSSCGPTSSGNNVEVTPPKSLADELARRLCTRAEPEELAALPKYDDECWASVYNQLMIHRGDLAFDRVMGRCECEFAAGRGGMSIFSRASRVGSCVVTTKGVMRAGRHFIRVSGTKDKFRPGILRPSRAAHHSAQFHPFNPSDYTDRLLLEERTGRWGSGNVHCCMLGLSYGKCHWTDWARGYPFGCVDDWTGSGQVFPAGCEIGLLLDLVEGAISVYRDGKYVGVLKRGLTGEYCWAFYCWSSIKIYVSRGSPNVAHVC
ncbi:hypothetical protein THAOC_12367 [Thalassiosira oceanica]|uniref:B30.2/SPRY domain-containing protein n=1 Tax=Thalassiosira oceanica TaxID=159749 RepID=K0SKC3_THAOC|nr:hypothetical protein THAOC_12367 [Thalassiosira oceanica]|eukprot:EJK66688.1 hypothetical protein THAOC_12367 [Thalassiosira oceanica]